jgi:hypothetical protein
MMYHDMEAYVRAPNITKSTQASTNFNNIKLIKVGDASTAQKGRSEPMVNESNVSPDASNINFISTLELLNGRMSKLRFT